MRLAILFAALLSSSCACWTPEHAQEPRCVIAHQIVDCTKNSVLASVVPLFSDIISQQGIDWNTIRSQIMARVEQMSYRDGGCLLATLEADFQARPKATHELALRAESVHSILLDFKKSHGTPNVTFRVRGADGQESFR